jgi:predicted dehydrogenase
MGGKFDFAPDPEIRCRQYNIGAIGAGFIMADVQLAAYHWAGFHVHAISSRTSTKAAAVAARWNIGTVHDTPEALLADEKVEIVDIAYPPHLQGEIIEAAAHQPHIKGILAQKPLTMDYAGAKRVVDICRDNGKVLSINQNMRYDQSMRVLQQILARGYIGRPVTATIEMRAIPHWQEFLSGYHRLTLLNMSIHHLDVMRFLFGEVEEIFTMARRDPRTQFEHTDGICVSTLKFKNGLLGMSIDDTWASPTDEGFDADIFIAWRVEGEEGLVKGTIGWPDYPQGSPSTLSFCAPVTEGKWVSPSWSTMWFPHAFAGVMEQLQYALKTDQAPALSADDNLHTMALVEAAYMSIDEHRAVKPAEIEKLT